MNKNESRNWLLWIVIILAVVAVVYFVKNRMSKPEIEIQEIVVVEEDMSPETQVDAVAETQEVE